MRHQPYAAVWEITMGCNMRCKHCGSACRSALPDELTTEEALRLCDDIGELGLKYVTISGGEPLTRSDFHLIAKRLKERGVTPHIITNGWLLTEELLDKVANIGMGTFAISLDGVRETHDYMRMPGSFDRIMAAFDLLKKTNVTTAAITTVNNKNIGELGKIGDILIEKGIHLWQLQIGLPMGNFADFDELLLAPEQMDDIIDFAYNMLDEKRIRLFLADCIGYYNVKEIAVRDRTFNAFNAQWQGCSAGKSNVGILHNGDIVGCASVRDRQYIEGNIRQTPLREIWHGENSFQWSRTMAKSKLSGLCHKCAYGDRCLGGCPNTRLTMSQSIYAENIYCSYHAAMTRTLKKVSAMADPEKLFRLGQDFAEKGNWQLAEMTMARALELDPGNAGILRYYGFVCYMLGNYGDARAANEQVLAAHPDDLYAHKGLGLTLVKLGDPNSGIAHLKKATALSSPAYMNAYHDLALTLIELGRRDEAIQVIAEGSLKSPEFAAASVSLYRLLNETAAQSA
ncbi:radical SAM protein [Heliobacterium gestii]|uniref:Radical SAM protein n=1 Tax=Heliomicrobium gestii TaxID=2699 RepID=A0A845LIR6_HELGE|nr:radical SAM protein [Heliomicrobium gestii]MBM7866460.1 radical SAM protein with 4Fe4S-binding SPASM domain [Heliomicrobium gestii]MZP42756.1 radical SAM protein [Heliomicrobium gestii]